MRTQQAKFKYAAQQYAESVKTYAFVIAGIHAVVLTFLIPHAMLTLFTLIIVLLCIVQWGQLQHEWAELQRIENLPSISNNQLRHHHK
jgi:hypothetical protein